MEIPTEKLLSKKPWSCGEVAKNLKSDRFHQRKYMFPSTKTRKHTGFGFNLRTLSLEDINLTKSHGSSWLSMATQTDACVKSRAYFCQADQPIWRELPLVSSENHLFSILCSICFVHTFHFNILPPCFDNWFHDVSAIYSLIVHNLASMFDHSCPIKTTILQPTFPWSCPRYVHHRYLVVHPT